MCGAKLYEMKHANELINATSPYLLQHANNPVNWHMWDEVLFEKAQKEKKLVIISIGYAACHWCHVMEHESFEDTVVARVMNENFICIKVDREERPDVDHYYMSAVQLMNRQGGWPLNVITLPDGRPIWGGTYFPKENWLKNITSVSEYYKENKKQTEDFAERLQNGVEQVSLFPEVENVTPVSSRIIEQGIESWKRSFDVKEGGREGAPKFPMPVNLDFLLYYGFIREDDKVMKYVETTLDKMARGGIYDQIGGGFARYSVDEKWKVPHFEKMLYDNAQLISIYSIAYQHFKKEEYKHVVYQTIEFTERELKDKRGLFYSSLDADSEGEEGKFYIWKKEDIVKLLGTEYDLFGKYYNLNSKGFWEHGKYILLRDKSDDDFASENGISRSKLREKVVSWNSTLLEERSTRIRPALDNKILTAWNALMITGLVDAFRAFGEEKFVDLAISCAGRFSEDYITSERKLFRCISENDQNIDGFSEDYALLIQAFLCLFEITGKEDYLNTADALMQYTFENFFDEKTGLFLFYERKAITVVTNHFQKEDNVIPSANSVMANNLYHLFLLMGRTEYLGIVKKMLQYESPHFTNYASAYANWGSLMLKITEPFYEVAVCGNNAKDVLSVVSSDYRPNILWAFSETESDIPLLKDRYVKDQTLIYICHEGVCKLPVRSAEEAIKLIE